MIKFFTIALLATSLTVAGYTPATSASSGSGLIESLLFAPTYDHDYVPRTTGTRYDCRNAVAQYGAENVWYGLIGGRKKVDFKTRPFSRDGCFRSRSECRAFLTYVSGFLNQTFTRECRKGYRG